MKSLGQTLWWLWRDSPKERNATLDQEGRWPQALVEFRSSRALPVEPYAAPPGWMTEAGSHTLIGNWMPVSIAFVERQGQARQVNLPPIGPVDDTTLRAHALQAALASSLAGMTTAPRGG